MTPDADSVANCVLSTFDKLPEKRKPRTRRAGAREWVPLAGVVLVDNGMASMHVLQSQSKLMLMV